MFLSLVLPTSQMDFNSALTGAGDFGAYQKLLILLLVVPSGALCALVYFAQYFIILLPEEYGCHLASAPPDDLLAVANFTRDSLRVLATPPDPSRGGSPSRCLMYDVNLTDIIGAGIMETNSSWPVVGCKDGWDYQFGNLYPTIATQVSLKVLCMVWNAYSPFQFLSCIYMKSVNAVKLNYDNAEALPKSHCHNQQLLQEVFMPMLKVTDFPTVVSHIVIILLNCSTIETEG